MPATLKKFINKLIFLVNFGQSPLLLTLRFWIANIFFKSGYLKITDFDNAITLFTYEHPVPFMPPLMAAISGTFFEIICSLMLFLGLGTRLACLPLLVMTAVINFTYMQNIQHFYWAAFMGTLLFFGPGAFSIDYFIKRKFG